MELPIDYLITRAKGIQSHLFVAGDYKKFQHMSNYSDFVNQLRTTAYSSSLDQYYTTADPIHSLVRTVFMIVDRRWKLLTTNAPGTMLQQIRKYKIYIDMKNLYVVYQHFSHQETRSTAEPLFSVFPGGTISLALWRELSQSHTLKEFENKVSLLLPAQQQFFPVLTSPGVNHPLQLLDRINELYFDKTSPTSIKPNPLAFFLLDLVNKLLLRISLQTEDLTSSDRQHILQSLSYWQQLPGFIGKDLATVAPDQWYVTCYRVLVSTSSSDNQDETSYLEDKATEFVLHAFRRYLKFHYDRQSEILLILHLILIEAYNIIWIAAGIYYELPRSVIMERVIL